LNTQAFGFLLLAAQVPFWQDWPGWQSQSALQVALPATHWPFVHTWPVGQSVEVLHCDDEPGTHVVRFGSHTWPVAQSALVLQVALVLHVPDAQYEPTAQSASVVHALLAATHWPLAVSHFWPVAQSLSLAHGVELDDGVQVPFVHVWPEGQLALVVQVTVGMGSQEWRPTLQVMPCEQSPATSQKPASMHEPVLASQ
jgi:hypothetical protein